MFNVQRPLKICLLTVLFLATLVTSVEGKPPLPRHRTWICGAALLGLAATVATFWFDETPVFPGSQWNDEDFTPVRPTALDLTKGIFQFSQGDLGYAEVKILHETFFAEQIAKRVKAVIVRDEAKAAELKDWDKPGVRVPLRVMTFERDPEDPARAHVILTGHFLTLKSEEPVVLEEVQAGETQTVRFKFRRAEPAPLIGVDQGIELSFGFSFRFDPSAQMVDDVNIEGEVQAFGPAFYPAPYPITSGPFTAHPASRVAER